MKPVRWGMLGVGRHLTNRIIPPLRESALVDIRGIASRSPEKARRISLECGAEAYSPYEALLADGDVEAVFISLPNHLHLEWIKKAADAGKHILCEKPVTMTGEEAVEAFEYARGKGVRLMEAFMYRFHAQWREARELVRSGAIGDLRQVHTSFSYDNSDPDNIRNKLETGGGALYDIGCYALSVAQYIFDAGPDRILGLLDRDPVFGTDSLTSGIADFGGRHATFTVGTRTFPHQKVEIAGTGGMISISPPFNVPNDVPAVLIMETADGRQEIGCDPTDQYRLQFDAFSRCLREGGAIPVTPEDSIEIMHAIDALFSSERSGTWEPVSRAARIPDEEMS